jgi:hypothetical protein
MGYLRTLSFFVFLSSCILVILGSHSCVVQHIRKRGEWENKENKIEKETE